ncbi:MAG: TolC family protein [Gemmatimonadota bacterium]
MGNAARWSAWLGIAFLAAAPAPAGAQEAAAVRPLSLDAAIAEALEGNASLAVARAESDRARAESKAAASPLWPRIDVSTGWTRSNDPVFAFGTKLRQGIFAQADLALEALNSPDPISDWSTGASLQWKLLSPREWVGRSVASRAAEAAGWTEVRTREATVLVTEARYYEAQRAAAQLAAAERAEEAARSARDAFARREAEGLLTRAELLQAEAEFQAAVAARIDAGRRDAEALRRLAVHLGWSPEVRPLLTDSLDLGTIDAGVDTAEAAPAVGPGAPGPEGRADLRALDGARDAAAANSTRARLGYLPELEGFGGWAMHGADPFGSDGDNWVAGLVLRWNVFSGFGRSADAKRADAERAVAEARYDEALRSARAEAEEAREAVLATRRAAAAAVVGDSAASLGRDLMKRRFEEGLATATDLLAAEARAATARSRAIDAVAGQRMAEARLRFVTTRHTSE